MKWQILNSTLVEGPFLNWKKKVFASSAKSSFPFSRYSRFPYKSLSNQCQMKNCHFFVSWKMSLQSQTIIQFAFNQNWKRKEKRNSLLFFLFSHDSEKISWDIMQWKVTWKYPSFLLSSSMSLLNHNFPENKNFDQKKLF